MSILSIYPAIRKEMEYMTEITEFTKDELVDIIMRSLQKGDSILADTIDAKILEKGTEDSEEALLSMIGRAYMDIERECNSYAHRVEGLGYWDFKFEHIQSEVQSSIQNNIRNVVEAAAKAHCTEPTLKFLQDVGKLMRSHDDDYYFFWITDCMDDFFNEMEAALEDSAT